jgi:hypothetical protein
VPDDVVSSSETSSRIPPLRPINRLIHTPARSCRQWINCPDCPCIARNQTVALAERLFGLDHVLICSMHPRSMGDRPAVGVGS